MSVLALVLPKFPMFPEHGLDSGLPSNKWGIKNWSGSSYGGTAPNLVPYLVPLGVHAKAERLLVVTNFRCPFFRTEFWPCIIRYLLRL
jgi:hypothetical protein